MSAEKISPGQMMRAAEEGDLQIVTAITKKYGLSHCTSWLDGYAIMNRVLSRSNGDPHIAKFLIEAGAKLTIREGENDIFCKAVSRNICFVPVVKRLLRKGASVNARNSDGDSPLHCVRRLGIARLLFTFDADSPPDVNAVNSFGRTPLYVAAMKANSTITKFLLENGADVNRRSSEEDECNTPLHAVVQYSRGNYDCSSVFNALVTAGADVNARNASGKTPLHLTVVDRRSGFSTEEVLSKPAVDIEAKDNEGMTALARAADELAITPLETLLKYGADVNVPNNKGLTPLQIVEQKRSNLTVVDIRFSLRYLKVRQVSMILRCHIAKLKCADLHVSEDNLLACQVSRYEDEIDLTCQETTRETLDDPDFVKSCTDEVEKMKNERVGDSCVSYYDLVSRSRRQVVNYTRNALVLRGMCSDSKLFFDDSLAVKFPLYGRWIAVRYRQTKKRAKLQDAALASLTAIFEFLPELCVDRIIDFLSNGDLEKCSASLGR